MMDIHDLAEYLNYQGVWSLKMITLGMKRVHRLKKLPRKEE